MKETKHITIKIAGKPNIGLDIPADRVSAIRQVENSVNKIWGRWCIDFPEKTPDEVLAMVTFQFARYYYDLLESVEAGQSAIEDFERRLDDILLDVK